VAGSSGVPGSAHAKPSAKLVTVDPLMAHLGGRVKSFQDQSVRSALAPLYRAAQAHRCPPVVVVHLNKGDGADALYRTGGTIGLPAAARSALLLARNPDDPDGEQGSERVLAHVKTNVGRFAPSLAYRIEPIVLPDSGIETARIVEHGQVDLAGSDLLNVKAGENRPRISDAAEFLVEQLGDGEWHPGRPMNPPTARCGPPRSTPGCGEGSWPRFAGRT
jgi:hypothetical protein